MASQESLYSSDRISLPNPETVIQILQESESRYKEYRAVSKQITDPNPFSNVDFDEELSHTLHLAQELLTVPDVLATTADSAGIVIGLVLNEDQISIQYVTLNREHKIMPIASVMSVEELPKGSYKTLMRR